MIDRAVLLAERQEIAVLAPRAAGPPRAPGRQREPTRDSRRERGTRGRNLLVLVTLALVSVGIWLAAAQAGVSWHDVRAIVASPEAFQRWIDGFGPWAPAVFVLAEAVQVIAAPIPGSIFPPVGAAAFGPGLSIVLSLAGMGVGSAVVFALARRWGRALVLRLVDVETFDRYIRVVGSRGGLWLFLILLFPILPGDAVCALGGLSTISFRRFLLVTTLGRLPGTVLSAYLVSGLLERPAWVWLVAGALLLAGMGLALRCRPWLEARLLRHPYRASPSSPPAALPDDVPAGPP